MMKMENGRAVAAGLAGILILAACAATGTITGGISKPEAIVTLTRPNWTRTPRPTVTETPTPTMLPTVEPMVTPSPGPAPDLEILRGNANAEERRFYAEIRNNTDTLMIFPGYEHSFTMTFEEWVDLGKWDKYHFFFSDVSPYPGEYQPCFLYPGETGLFYTFTDNYDQMKRENVTSVPFTGIRLDSYEGHYRTWDEFKQLKRFAGKPDDLGTTLHPETDNVQVRIEGGLMFMEFDVSLEKPKGYSLTFYPVWFVLYDVSNSIINVYYLSSLDMCDSVDCFHAGMSYQFRVSGAACLSGACNLDALKAENPGLQLFRSKAPITQEEIARIDHYRAFVEIKDPDICSEKIDWDAK
jgi:hypothetical protein